MNKLSDFNFENMFSLQYLMAKVNYLENRLTEIPNVTVGVHMGHEVLNVYTKTNNTIKRTQHRITTPVGKKLFDMVQERREITNQIGQLYLHCEELKKYNSIQLKPAAILPYSIKSSLKPDSNNIPKPGNYWFKGIQMRSRLELLTAEVIDSLGLEFMYEVCITINGHIYYPDFIVFLPELGCCFLIECLGKTDDINYLYQNNGKIIDYLNSGYRINENLLLFSGTNGSVPNPSIMKADIIHLINNLASKLVVKN